MQTLFARVIVLIAVAAGFACQISGQSQPPEKTLGDLLSQNTKFVPRDDAPPNQLIEVAKMFRIPMGIEWLDEKEGRPPEPLVFHGGTVENLIQSIVQRSPDHIVSIEDRIVRVYSSSAYSNPLNLLNLRIPEYSVSESSLLGADYALRGDIKTLLYPPPKDHGSNGGYGCGCPVEFWDRNITISGSNLAIREILNLIVESHEKFLWIVRLNADELTGDKPKWIGVPIDASGWSPISSRWKFVLLFEEHPEPGRPGGGSGSSTAPES